MTRLFVLLAAIASPVLAKQSCYSCTSAASVDVLNGWLWGPNLTDIPPNVKFGSQNCNLNPLMSDSSVNDCASMCFVWQYNYTDPTGNPAYETIRGCASDVPGLVYPNQEGCNQNYQYPAGGPSNPNPNQPPGKYSVCFCNGDYCNSCIGKDCSSVPTTTAMASSTVTTSTAATFQSTIPTAYLFTTLTLSLLMSSYF
uniref:Uncharacterized protein n=1 Tax=Plectus sambesii TaxID=2011161 RepID=A0A914WJK0_9BILA